MQLPTIIPGGQLFQPPVGGRGLVGGGEANSRGGGLLDDLAIFYHNINTMNILRTAVRGGVGHYAMGHEHVDWEGTGSRQEDLNCNIVIFTE